jgi:hypothetical protein
MEGLGMVLQDVLTEIRSRPGIILGRKSVHTLHAFLAGFLYAQRDCREQSDYAILSGFNEWVRKRYNVQSSQGWARTIAFYSMDESEELSLFWKLFDQYVEASHESKRNGKRKAAKKSSA